MLKLIEKIKIIKKNKKIKYKETNLLIHLKSKKIKI